MECLSSMCVSKYSLRNADSSYQSIHRKAVAVFYSPVCKIREAIAELPLYTAVWRGVISSVDLARISAPSSRSIFEMAMFPLTQAKCSGVIWEESFELTSTLAWRNKSFATWSFPRRAAKCNAVLPFFDAKAGLAPLSINKWTVAVQLNLCKRDDNFCWQGCNISSPPEGTVTITYEDSNPVGDTNYVVGT